MMRSESTSAFGQPRLTKPTRGAVPFAGLSLIGALIGETRVSVDGRDAALAQQLLDFGIRGLFGIALVRRAGTGVRLRIGPLFLGGRGRLPLARATAALFDLDVTENAADRLADRLPFEPLLYRLAALVYGLVRLLVIRELLLDLGSDGRPVERALDANRHGKTGKVVGAALAFGARHGLGTGGEVHSSRAQRSG